MPVDQRTREIARGLALDLCYGSAPGQDGPYGRRVLWGERGSAVVEQLLASGEPCMVARFGSTELACVNFHTRWRRGRRIRLPYLSQIRRIVQVNSGIFPTDDEALDRFCDVYLQAVARTDVMGVWFNRNEERIVGRHCPEANLVELGALNCVTRENPWSAALQGKTVLVVHPFARTIESQYRKRRALLFDNPRILPEFELKTLIAVQSIAGNDSGHASWVDALEHMRGQIAALDFDVAIIGAGAYGLPLAAAVKDMGRQAVHLGGATQLLFGIRGRRWEVESPDDIAPLFNEHWVRPSAEETPDGCELVEGGCYW